MIRLLPILLLLSSCSAVWHHNRAIDKDSDLCKSDTVIVERTIPGDSGTAVGMDSVLVDNERVWIKALATGKIDLRYTIKDVVIQDTTETKVVPATPKGERKEWRKEKRRRKEDRRDRREDRRHKKEDRKLAREERRTVEVIESTKRAVARNEGWNLLLVGIAIGLSISMLYRILIKRFLANFAQ
jgi:hypothetical protein